VINRKSKERKRRRIRSGHQRKWTRQNPDLVVHYITQLYPTDSRHPKNRHR